MEKSNTRHTPSATSLSHLNGPRNLFRLSSEELETLKFASETGLNWLTIPLQQRLETAQPSLSPLARQLAALFDIRETLTNSQAAALTGANRSTLKAKFNDFIAAGLIQAHDKGRGAFYARKQIELPSLTD